MMRIDALHHVGGFDASMIAGEEPELCVRLRRAGWRVVRLDAEMTLHDAAIASFSQWWWRAVRNGYAFALGASKQWRHGLHWVRETVRIWTWTLVVPVGAVALARSTHGGSLLALMAYPVLVWRGARSRTRRGDRAVDAVTYGLFCVVGRVPELIGQVWFVFNAAFRRRQRAIEYKRAAAAGEHGLGGGSE